MRSRLQPVYSFDFRTLKNPKEIPVKGSFRRVEVVLVMGSIRTKGIKRVGVFGFKLSASLRPACVWLNLTALIESSNC